jgi:hypothetical protein
MIDDVQYREVSNVWYEGSLRSGNASSRHKIRIQALFLATHIRVAYIHIFVLKFKGSSGNVDIHCIDHKLETSGFSTVQYSTVVSHMHGQQSTAHLVYFGYMMYDV